MPHHPTHTTRTRMHETDLHLRTSYGLPEPHGSPRPIHPISPPPHPSGTPPIKILTVPPQQQPSARAHRAASHPARALTRQMAFKRYLVQHVATILVPGLNWIDGLWQLWDKPYRQCLHDKFAETVVIKLDA